MLQRSAFRAAASVTGLVLVAAGLAAAVRLLPWLLDARVPLHVALPFARGLAAIALEASLLLGWPIGWALAAHRLVERGEALALQSLGEAPTRTVRRLALQGAAFAALVGAASLVGGRDANEPGRVVTELLEEGRAACAAPRVPSSFAVPFSGTTWLCRPDAPPRLVGRAPGALPGVFFSARAARVAGDLRQIELDDARLALGAGEPGRTGMVHVGTLALRGLPPWAQASSLPPTLRSVLLAASGVLAAALAALAALLRRPAPRGRVHAILVGAAGPLAALALLRLLERTEVGAAVYLTVPVACALAVLGAAAVVDRSLRLLDERAAATK
jgi:hypothetical protein